MSNPSASSPRALSRTFLFAIASSFAIISDEFRSATVPSARAIGARVGSRDGMPISIKASTVSPWPQNGQCAETGGRAAQQFLVAEVLV